MGLVFETFHRKENSLVSQMERTEGCINYNPVLVLRQLRYPMIHPLDKEAIVPLVVYDLGVQNRELLKKLRQTWRNVVKLPFNNIPQEAERRLAFDIPVIEETKELTKTLRRMEEEQRILKRKLEEA
ncbi:hypothetical protein CR513_40442, partial [Mucuna pruriens]